MNNELFNFSDVSDLPEELAAKMQTQAADRADQYRPYVAVLEAAAEAGVEPVNINQVMAVAIRMDSELKVPAASTVRNYLNAAVEAGVAMKPTRQTYATPAWAATDEGKEWIAEAEAAAAKVAEAKAAKSNEPEVGVVQDAEEAEEAEEQSQEVALEDEDDNDPLAGL